MRSNYHYYQTADRFAGLIRLGILALIAYAIFSASFASGHDLPIHQCVPGVVESKPLARTVNLGLGRHVDDIYSRIPTNDPLVVRLRNACIDRSDPANTLHELTHLYNKLLSNQVSRKTAGDSIVLYLLHNKAVVFTQPNVTLKQVAMFVDKEHRRSVYKSYLVEAQPWYNSQPLFFLDEAICIGHGMLSIVEAGGKDNWRAAQCLEAAICTTALLECVKTFDTEYEYLDELIEFCNWHNQRLIHLFAHEDHE